jgi:uncharacterized membrane protein
MDSIVISESSPSDIGSTIMFQQDINDFIDPVKVNPNNDSIEYALNQVIDSVGINSVGSRLLVWLIISIILTVVSITVFNSGTIQAFVGGAVFIMMFITGWFMGFIPTALFAFMILIGIVAVGFFVKNAFAE